MKVLASIGEGLAEISLTHERADALLACGGDAANLLVMAARLGAPTRLGGRVGADELGRRLMAYWREQSIDVSAIRVDHAASTGLYINEQDEAGDHRFVYWRNDSAGSRLEPGDLGTEFFDQIGILVVTGITLAVSETSAAAALHAVTQARRRGARVACVLNHRPALGGDVAALGEFARSSDIVIASREDTAAVFDTRAQAEIRARLDGPAEIVLTDGAAPALALVDGEAIRQPPPPVTVRNAAGAGDALAGAYLAARLRGEPPARSLAWGVAAASLSVTRDGCASAYPTASETAALVGRLAPQQKEAV